MNRLFSKKYFLKLINKKIEYSGPEFFKKPECEEQFGRIPFNYFLKLQTRIQQIVYSIKNGIFIPQNKK